MEKWANATQTHFLALLSLLLRLRWCNTFHISFHSIVNWFYDHVLLPCRSTWLSTCSIRYKSHQHLEQFRAFSFNELALPLETNWRQPCRKKLKTQRLIEKSRRKFETKKPRLSWPSQCCDERKSLMFNGNNFELEKQTRWKIGAGEEKWSA